MDDALTPLLQARGRTQPFNRGVHGARGFFAILVFAFHVSNSGLRTYWPTDYWLARYLFFSLKFGVELFFAISGFVIVGALARSSSARAFLWDRATRIYPLLWITLLSITAVSAATGLWLPSLPDWLLNFLAPPPFFPLPQVNPAAWSLGYEVTFYAFCALCWATGAFHARWRLLTILIAGSLLVFYPRAILMPAGVLIAAARMDRGWAKSLSRSPGLLLVVFLLAWRWLELCTPDGDIALLTPHAMQTAHWLTLLPVELLAGFVGLLALCGIVDRRGWLGWLLCTAPLQRLGTISYSLYLWHPVVMAAAKSLLHRSGMAEAVGPHAQLLFAVLTLPPSIGIAHASQLLVEVRLTRFLRRLGPSPASAHAPVTAVASGTAGQSAAPPERPGAA